MAVAKLSFTEFASIISLIAANSLHFHLTDFIIFLAVVISWRTSVHQTAQAGFWPTSLSVSSRSLFAFQSQLQTLSSSFWSTPTNWKGFNSDQQRGSTTPQWLMYYPRYDNTGFFPSVFMRIIFGHNWVLGGTKEYFEVIRSLNFQKNMMQFAMFFVCFPRDSLGIWNTVNIGFRNHPPTVVSHVSIWFWKLCYPNRSSNWKFLWRKPFKGVFKPLPQLSVILSHFWHFCWFLPACYLINPRRQNHLCPSSAT